MRNEFHQAECVLQKSEFYFNFCNLHSWHDKVGYQNGYYVLDMMATILEFKCFAAAENCSFKNGPQKKMSRHYFPHSDIKMLLV
jgi:hypothetical protein